MGRFLVVLALAAACGGAQHPKARDKAADCNRALDLSLKITGGQTVSDKDRQLRVARCVDKLTPEQLDCFLAVKTKDDLDHCDAAVKENEDTP